MEGGENYSAHHRDRVGVHGGSLHPVVEEEGQQNYKGPPSPQPQTIPPVDGAAATGLS